MAVGRGGDDTPKPEHGHLILYVFGAVALSLGCWVAARAVQEEGAWAGEGVWAIGLGAVAVFGGALLHHRLQRRWPEAAEDDAPDSGERWGRIGVGLLVLPLLAAWVQFELFVDPIQMFPFTTVVGGLLASYGLARLVLPQGRARRVFGPSFAAGVGVPGALLAHVLLVGHFTHHLCTVQVWALPGDQITGADPAVVHADLPQMESELELPDAQLALMAALDAQPVDASEFRVDANGTLVHVGHDGTHTPARTLSAEALEAMFDRARRGDEAAARDARERQRAAYQAELQALRRGGRLFH